MKSKAKPAKGSARTKRFDVGGTVGALAGLGTLAYLMSRKKKGADGAEPSKDLLKDAQERAPKQPDTPTADDAGRQRALDQSKDPRLNYMPDDSDRKELYSDINAKRTDGKGTKPVVNKPKPRLTPKAQVDNSGQGSSTNTGLDAGIAAGNKKAENKGFGAVTKLDENSPQAKAIRAQRDERTRQKFLQSKAGLSGKGITTPGDPSKKEATSKAGVVLGGSTVRSDKDKMAERAREVQRRREEEMKSRYKKGGAVKKMASGGMTRSSASKRADGIAQRGKTRGKVC
jgi:hypothetical protein